MDVYFTHHNSPHERGVNENAIAGYLTGLLEEKDPNLLITAIGDIAKAKGMSQIAKRSGLGRESLYKALAPDSKPRFETILKVLHSIGLQLKFEAALKVRKKAA